jgi:hypothetical protein
MHKIQPLLLILLLTWIPLLNSCSEGDLSIGDKFVDSDAYTAILNISDLELSTIKVDSVVTSSSGVALCGYAENNQTRTKATSYFRITKTTDNIDDEEVLDSLCLVLKHSGYYYGDTAELFKMNIHLLNEEIENNKSNTICSDESFEYNPTPIGTLQYYPKPIKENDEDDEEEIRLDDSLGQQFLDSLQQSGKFTSDDFYDWIKGIVLVPDTTVNKSIIGYYAAADSINLRLYTHASKLGKIEYTHDFPLYDASLQFNQILSYTDNDALNSIDSDKDKIPEDDFDNSAILQGGTGYLARIDFSSLSSFKTLQEDGIIVKAILTVGVKDNSDQYKTPPTTLYLQEATKTNSLSSYIINSSNEAVYSNVQTINPLYEKEYQYQFDITYFLKALLYEEIIEEGTGIILTLAPSQLAGSTDKVTFKGFKDSSRDTKLNIFYYHYDKE